MSGVSRKHYVLITEGLPTPGSKIPMDRVELGLGIFKQLEAYGYDTSIIVSGHFLNDEITEYVKGELEEYGISDPEGVIVRQREPRLTEEDIFYTLKRVGWGHRIFVPDSHYRKDRFESDVELIAGRDNDFKVIGQYYPWPKTTILYLQGREKMLALIGKSFSFDLREGSGAKAYSRRYKVYKALSQIPIVGKLTGLSDVFGD